MNQILGALPLYIMIIDIDCEKNLHETPFHRLFVF